MMQQMLVGLGGLSDPVYVDDVFKTKLYTGNSSTKDINNGIDLDGKGGLVWLKNRENAAFYTQSPWHHLYDTERLVGRRISTNEDGYQINDSGSGVTAFNSNGFSFSNQFFSNRSGIDYVSWTFRKQKGFFDIVTFSGSGTNSTNRRISHSLGSVPGMIFVKRLSSPDQDWRVYHRERGVDQYQALNNDTKFTTGFNCWGTAPTSSDFGINEDNLSASTGDFVAYLFAHEDARFGANRDESIIKCGTYNGNNSNRTIPTGFKPGFVMIKTATTVDNWVMFDNKRGTNELDANRDSSDDPASDKFSGFSSTGFDLVGGNGATNSGAATYIYMAIREGL